MCPVYTFENTKTGAIYDDMMTISEMEEYLAKNKHIRHIIKSQAIVDPVGIGISKPPVDFQRHVLGRIKDKNPGATAIANKRWGIPREI